MSPKPSSQSTRPAHRISCCVGGAFHEITVHSSGSTLSLYRCTSCDRQQWTRDGEPVAREAALEVLASSYRKIPIQRNAAAADLAAARQSARQQVRSARAPKPAPKPEPAETPELVELLDGWTVLGTS